MGSYQIYKFYKKWIKNFQKFERVPEPDKKPDEKKSLKPSKDDSVTQPLAKNGPKDLLANQVKDVPDKESPAKENPTKEESESDMSDGDSKRTK